ncbi:MAG: hypothetical protein ACP5K9_00840 [Candidatus Micrarchaeia archaeon]
MELNDTNIYAYAIYAFAVLSLISAALFGSATLLLLALVLSAASVIYMHSGRIINGLILSRSRVIELSGGYSLDGSMTSAVKREGGSYKSVSIAELKMDKPLQYKSEQFAEIIEKAGVPFEFTIGIRKINTKAFTEALETRRRMKEIAISNTPSSSYERISRLKRELSMIENEIKSVEDGSKPVEAFAYLRSFATGSAAGIAARESQEQLAQVAEIFRAALGIGYSVCKGEDLLRIVGD